MKMTLLIATTLFIIACNNAGNNKPVTTNDSIVVKDTAHKQLSVDTIVAEQPKADSVYAYIKKVTERNDSIVLDADYIQFLTGDAAIAAAKIHHEADTMYDAKGKITDITVPDDYYILNESKKIRQLALAKDAVLQFMDNQYRQKPIKDNSVNSLKLIYGEAPYILTLKGTTVVKLEEVYLP